MNVKAAMLLGAGLLSVGMGSFHLWLPGLFNWSGGMRAAPDSLRWALLSLNFFWSALTLLMGALVTVLALRRDWMSPPGRWLLLALAAYWASHATYLAVRPFPLPDALLWLGRTFIAFATVQALLHAWPVLPSRSKGKAGG